MALQISYDLVLNNSCNSINILDTTGVYDAGTNPTGWGAPNPTTGNITAAVLKVYDNAHAEILEYNFFADIADFIATTGLDISSTTLFSEDTFPDGYYKFTVVLTVSAVDYEYDVHQGFICAISCCVRKMSLQMVFPICDFKQVQRTALAFQLLQSAIWAGCAGQAETYAKIIEYLSKTYSECIEQTSGSEGCGCS